VQDFAPKVLHITGASDVGMHSKTGYIAHTLDEFVAFTEFLLNRQDVLPPMCHAARHYALSTSWESSFESMCEAYERYCCGTKPARAVHAHSIAP
jgi:hypothetical protein